MTRRVRALLVPVLVASAFACATCSKTPDTTTTTPSPSPDPTNTIPNLGGSWTGTLESSSFATRTITMQVTQTGVDCVDGTWQTVPPEWSGAISGFAKCLEMLLSVRLIQFLEARVRCVEEEVAVDEHAIGASVRE